MSSFQERRRVERMPRDALRRHQLARLNALLEAILPHNEFYAARLRGAPRPLRSLAQLAEFPLLTKDDLQADGNADVARHHTWPDQRYVRFHQTSGTSGRPLVVLDTADDWAWWLAGWQFVLDAAAITPADRAVMAFSFGPFIGFWTAFEAAAARGCLVVPGGGLDSAGRIDLLRRSRATALFCTPSYALRMAEVAEQQGLDAATLGVGKLVLAGEPGGSIPATRARLQRAWNAAVTDHAGATEVGPWGYGDDAGRGLHVLESEFVAEFLVPGTSQPAPEGQPAELVLTTLGRAGCPVIRYRTGDIVRPVPADGDNRFVLLEGGVLGRADEMLIVRGVNLYPGAIEQVLRGFPEVVEYRATVCRAGTMDRVDIEIEDRRGQPQRVADELRRRLGLSAQVVCVPIGSLPRFEGKGRRLVDRRP